MAHRSTARTAVSVPDDLRSARAKLVYRYLAVAGTATADEVRDALGLDTGTVLSITRTLREREYVRRVEEGYAVVRS